MTSQSEECIDGHLLLRVLNAHFRNIAGHLTCRKQKKPT